MTPLEIALWAWPTLGMILFIVVFCMNRRNLTVGTVLTLFVLAVVLFPVMLIMGVLTCLFMSWDYMIDRFKKSKMKKYIVKIWNTKI